jgi:hypothetical protein
MKARKEGLYISVQSVSGGMDGDDSTTSYEEYATTHNRDSIVSKTTDYIALNKAANYPTNFISEVNRKTNVSLKIIENMLSYLHIHDNFEVVQNLIILILSRCEISSTGDICKSSFSRSIKKHVISSKNNEEVNKIQRLIDHILDRFFKDKLRTSFNKYSNVHKIKIRNVIIYALEYNLFKVNCRNV